MQPRDELQLSRQIELRLEDFIVIEDVYKSTDFQSSAWRMDWLSNRWSGAAFTYTSMNK